MRHGPTIFLRVLCAALLSACGANVVFGNDGNQAGAGGAGASHGAGGFVGTGGTGNTPSVGGFGDGGAISTGPGCDTLQANFDSLLAQATACNACQDFDPCINGTVIQDECGCPVGTADQNLAQQAAAAYQTWVSAGCGPFDCGKPCVGGGTWFCTSNGTGCMGTCSVALGD